MIHANVQSKAVQAGIAAAWLAALLPVLVALPGWCLADETVTTSVRPFRASIPQASLDDLRSQGGDHGSVISDALARQAPAGLLGIHLSMPATLPANVVQALDHGGPAPAGLTAREREAFDALDAFFSRNAAYGAMMVTRPQTVGYALSDSPIGLAAWMYDKIAQWTYSGGVPERSLTIDEMLDDISLYWLTNSAISSARFYWENDNNNFSSAAQKTREISIPVAVTVFPGEIYRAPESWTRQAYRDLVYFHEVDKGGHFAAWEEPELFARELRAAFRSLR